MLRNYGKLLILKLHSKGQPDMIIIFMAVNVGLQRCLQRSYMMHHTILLIRGSSTRFSLCLRFFMQILHLPGQIQHRQVGEIFFLFVITFEVFL